MTEASATEAKRVSKWRVAAELLIVFALIAVPKTAFLLKSANSWELQPHNDEYRHLEYARNLWENGVFGREPGIPDDKEPILYPAYLAPFVGVIGFRPIAALWGQVILWSLAGMILYGIGRMRYGLFVGCLTAILFACYLPGMSYPSYFFTESHAIFLFVISIACVVMWERNEAQSAGWEILLGIACALHALTRVIAFPLVLPAIAYVGWRKWRSQGRILKSVLVVAVSFCAAYAPWVIRNQRTLGRPTVLLSKSDRAFSFGHRSAVFLAQGMSLNDARTKARDLSIPTPTGAKYRILAIGQRFQIMMGCNMRLGLPFPFSGRKFGNNVLVTWGNYLWNAVLLGGVFLACVIAIVDRDEVLGFLILFPLGLVVLYSCVHAIPRYQTLPYLAWCLPSAYAWSIVCQKIAAPLWRNGKART